MRLNRYSVLRWAIVLAVLAIGVWALVDGKFAATMISWTSFGLGLFVRELVSVEHLSP